MTDQAQMMTLGELLESEGGSLKTGPFGTVLQTDQYVESGVPVLAVRDIGKGVARVDADTPRVSESTAQRLSVYRLQAGDILFARKGAVERCALVKEDQSGWLMGSDCIRLRLPESVISAFVSYQLRSPSQAQWLRQHATGSTMPSLNQRILSRLPLWFPTVREQCSIAAILSALDDKIESNRKMNRTLEDIARALFETNFVDPTEHTKCPAQTASVPSNWRTVRIGELAELNIENWSPATAPKRIDYLDLSNVKWGETSDARTISFSEAPSRARRRLRDGDTILGTVRPGNGSFALIENPPPNLTGSTGFAVLSPKQDHLRYFIYLWLTRAAFISYLSSVAHGSAYPAVKSTVIQSTELALPPESTLREFHEIVRPLFQRLSSNERESRTLAALRDTLLPKLISGEIRVPEAEEIVEHAS